MMDIDKSWSIGSYRVRRASLLLKIAVRNGASQDLPMAPTCEHCGTTRDLHIHHPEENGGSYGIGGWRHLRHLEEEFDAGVPLMLLCGRKANGCHQKEHDRLHLGELPGRGSYQSSGEELTDES